METGDILTVAGGLLLVLVIALMANPQYFSDLHPLLPGGASPPAQTSLPRPAATTLPQTTMAAPSPAAVPAIPLTPVPPYRISYTETPFSYPVVRLPDRLDTLGESDIQRSGQDMVTFAFLEDSRGGLTRVFSVPYPVWSMDIRVVDNTTPNIASFRMALCYAANGTIIDGVELIHPGTAYKKIQTSNTPLYLIISTAGIEQYHISLQTSRLYYEQYRQLNPGAPGS